MHVLKGKLTATKSGAGLRRALVIFQFTASVALIAGTLIVYQQLNHLKKVDLGFEMSDIMVVRGPHANDSTFIHRLRSFKEELNNQASVQITSGSSNIPGEEIFWARPMRRTEDTRDKSFTVYFAGVDNEYFNTYNIDILAGRAYDQGSTLDTTNIIVNMAAVNSLGFAKAEEAIGQKIFTGGKEQTIIGVTNNYHQLSLKNNINPLMFPLNDHMSDYITIKLNSKAYGRVYDDVKATFDRFFPNAEFEAFFLDEFYNRQYANEQKFSNTFSLFALFAIIVACLGLFGLTSFSALQRTKEIGIRKVLGADVSQIVVILSKEFLILVVIANILALPIVYFIMDGWLENFASRIRIGIPVFMVSTLLVFIIAAISVGYKTLSTAKANPINALKYE